MKTITTILVALILISSLLATESRDVIIKLANDERTLSARTKQALQASLNKKTLFSIVPGLTDKNLVSIQLKGNKQYYVRHSNYVLYLHKFERESPLFEADATFRMISSVDGNVRFESSNYPGMFITVNSSGLVAIEKDRPVEQSTFVLE